LFLDHFKKERRTFTIPNGRIYSGEGHGFGLTADIATTPMSLHEPLLLFTFRCLNAARGVRNVRIDSFDMDASAEPDPDNREPDPSIRPDRQCHHASRDDCCRVLYR
jgi:hypothetical protein